MKKTTLALAFVSLLTASSAFALEFKPVEFRYWKYSNTQDGDFFSRVNYATIDTSFRIQAMTEATADQLESLKKEKEGTRWNCQAKSQFLSGGSPMINVFELKDCKVVQN